MEAGAGNSCGRGAWFTGRRPGVQPCNYRYGNAGNGWVDLAKAIKAKTNRPPVIMLSSIGDETRKKYPGLFSSVLIKPAKQANLCKAIQAALSKQVSAPAEGKKAVC